MVDWPQLTNMVEVRSFLGLAGYFRRFVEGFSKITAPMNRLTRKGEKFTWTPVCQLSFDELKRKLTKAPILTISVPGENFIASRVGLGVCLDAEGQYHYLCVTTAEALREVLSPPTI